MGAHFFEDREKSNTGIVEIKMSTESAEEFFQLDEEMQKTLQELEARGETEDNNGNITYGIDGPSFFSHHHYIEENR